MSKSQIYIIILILIIQNSFCVENDNSKLSETTKLLFNLTNYAIESRRIRNPCIHEPDDSSYFNCMKKLVVINQPYQYPSNYADGFNYYQQPYIYRPKPHLNYNKPYYRPQSIMDVLYTISKNDALRCVPRLLCEATSISGSSRQNFNLPTLPFNVDMESVIKLLATIDFPGGSPIPTFAKAALLGYVSKGNSDSCLEAYPTCPRDPNKLIQYLNNYNGGFFRFFNGLNPYYIPNNAENRIQTKPTFYDNDIFKSGSNLKLYNRLPKTLTFPSDDNNRFNEFTFKKPKELPFSINEYYSNELDLQKPLPNHRATPIIFPLRTGTGDLRLDSEELDANYKHKQYNNNFVSFRPNDDFYYEMPQGLPTREFNPNKASIAFPI